MEPIRINDLHFTYPMNTQETLRGVSLTVRAGEYVVLCGESGSGKTTLLRLLKSALAPQGTMTGSVAVCGQAPQERTLREDASTVGFVRQDPENAVVTDKAFHELAFALENLGVPQDEMRLRVAEIAGYFGMESWLDQSTDTLSGGQLQLLSLASALILRPQILLLDEPTSQLDPVAASAFLATIERLNRETGLTILLTEHRLEDALPCADRVVVLHDGVIAADCPPREIGDDVLRRLPGLRQSLPCSMRIHAAVESGNAPRPLTVREGRRWLTDRLPRPRVTQFPAADRPLAAKPAVQMQDVFFSYAKDMPDVLRGCSLEVPQGALFALLGGNGAGKSTALQTAAGLLQPYRGKVRLFGENVRKLPEERLYRGLAAVLPQQVQTLLTEKTALAELESIDRSGARETAARLGLGPLLERHPYDLSGGEMQRLALGKVLLTRPQILFLDEPTKGMDAAFKAEFAATLRAFCDAGGTVFLVSHDVEFCAKYADLCAMLFDGAVAAAARTAPFFAQHMFYTTAANRIAGTLFPQAVTDEEVIALCKANLP